MPKKVRKVVVTWPEGEDMEAYKDRAAECAAIVLGKKYSAEVLEEIIKELEKERKTTDK